MPLISRLSVLTVTRNRSLVSSADRVLRDRVGGAGLDVRRRAHLERDPLVPDVRRQPAQRRGPVAVDLHVVDDPHAVPEPVGAAPLDGLPDRRHPERLAGVDREVGVLALEVLERVEVPGGRVARLRARDVEADDPLVAVGDGQLGDLPAAGLVPHGGEQLAHHDRPVVGAGELLALDEPVPDGLHDLLQRQPGGQVLLGGVADLGVDHAVLGQVEHALAGHPAQLRLGLHHRDGVVEGLQVALERPAVGRLLEPAPQRLRVLRRQRVPGLGRELEDRLRPQPAVEVVVQQDLGGPGEQLAGDGTFGAVRHGPHPTRPSHTDAKGWARMRVFTTIDELGDAVGEDLGTTEWLEVTQERVDAFADATDDHQWIHVDVERAKAGPFGGTIAHGYLTLSLIPRFSPELFRLDTPGPRLNYGLNKVRFPNPVKVGARIRAAAQIAEVSDVPAGKQMVTRYTIEIEGEEKPACVAETVVLLLG